MSCEGTRRAVKAHLAGAAVDLEPAVAQEVGVGSDPASAQDRAQPRQKLARLEWLRQIIVRSHLDPDDAIHGIAACGQHQDRAFGPCANLPWSGTTTSSASPPCSARPRA